MRRNFVYSFFDHLLTYKRNMCIVFNSNGVVAFGIYQQLGAFEYELYIGFSFLVFSLLYHFRNKISYSIGAIMHRVPDSRSRSSHS